ncbi:protein CLEC16A homolog isoform X3 [Daphnia magna]|uniref:protein CLEC16A homolog isoform X3 n=1 Tax=Daphnia magna TaxID=35525 RepID=UPI001E1B9F49|nr:protein CLEC16A homolog isoform X3 [Daphnia magna]
MFRSRSGSWFGGSGSKPKNPHSLEHLKYLYNVMIKNQTVSESNRSLLVESLRSITEILIWGDQNDSSVFDFFLEKNMLSFFLRIMKQKCGSFVCVQLLQTLNILFENIRIETSLYYLLSNNHVNCIIVHKFDFSDEEVMAYYISFLKTLSLKLNVHTIHFFFNENTNDFPLYTEAIKFFNHSESMVRIAVRTLTLNVYKVGDEAMLNFIRDRTAAPYFSNLVWFIGNHIVELDNCVRADADHQSRGRLSDLVAEHLDHIHYVNDILCLSIDNLNEVLVEQLFQRLLLPLYINSLNKGQVQTKSGDRPMVSRVVSLFLLSQIFLIIHHKPLVVTILKLLINFEGNQIMPSGFNHESSVAIEDNITDEEKEQRISSSTAVSSNSTSNLTSHLETILDCLDPAENDYEALFGLSLLYAMGQNRGVNEDQPFWNTTEWKSILIAKLMLLLTSACQMTSKIRPVAVDLAINLLIAVAIPNPPNHHELDDKNLAVLEQAKEESIMVARTFFKSEDMFLELFEAEVNEIIKRPLQVEYLLQDSSILLPPTGTPMTGIEFTKRLPCGEVERARRAIRVFVLMRRLSLAISEEVETQLPLVCVQQCIKISDILDLSEMTLHGLTVLRYPTSGFYLFYLDNSDLIACTVVNREGTRLRRFLVIDPIQLILVEPDSRRLGWGVAKFVGFLQDVEVTGDKDDSRCLHVTVHNSPTSTTFLSDRSPAHRLPQLAARFVFDDHIRCMAAKQRLSKGRIKARQRKMHLIGKILDVNTSTPSSPPPGTLHALRQDSIARNAILGRGVPGNLGLSSAGTAFPSPFGIRPIGFRRAPGLAVTGRSDTPVRPRSSSAHPTVQRENGNKEAIPLTELSTSADHSQNSNQQDSSAGQAANL